MSALLGRVWSHVARPWVLVASAFVLVLLTRARGIHALSDDDYARIVIATRQADAPRLDPSGTSWLPFPFWLQGAAIALGRVLAVAPLDSARALALVLAGVGVWLLRRAGRALGHTEERAVCGAWLGLSGASAALLSGMCVPEFLTAALACFALCARGEANENGTRALAASLAVSAAALSRYEAWPVAFVVAIAALFARSRWRTRVADAALAVAGPCAWLVHNTLTHGDALHFLARVSAYSAKVGGGYSRAGIALAYLRALVSDNPLVALGTIATLIALWRRRVRLSGRYRIAFAGAGASIAFLLCGALLGGTPTHHPERALMLAGFMGALFVAELGVFARGLALLGLATLPFTLRTDGFSRAEQERVGRALAQRLAPGERVLLATPDLGFYALNASVGQPAQCDIDQEHDPRRPDGVSRFGDASDVARLRSAGVRYVIAPHTAWAAQYDVERDVTLALHDLTR